MGTICSRARRPSFPRESVAEPVLGFLRKEQLMSVRKRSWKNGDGVESVRWLVDVMDANGHRERRQFESKKEADAFRVATEGQMRAGTFRSDASKFTVKDAADRFLKHCESRRERGERMT